MIVAAGSPEEVAQDDKSYTSFYLNKEFELRNSKLEVRR
jgi:excinuclease UvrABC ATPase subunit